MHHDSFDIYTYMIPSPSLSCIGQTRKKIRTLEAASRVARFNHQSKSNTQTPSVFSGHRLPEPNEHKRTRSRSSVENKQAHRETPQGSLLGTRRSKGVSHWTDLRDALSQRDAAGATTMQIVERKKMDDAKKKPTAPKGLPGRSPTPVLSGPCTA